MTDLGKPEEVHSIGGAVPIIRINQSIPLGGQGAVMVFETYFGQDVSVKDINVVVDKMEAVGNRQALKGIVAAKKNQLDQAEIQDQNMARDILLIEEHYQRKQQESFASGRRTAATMSPKEEQDKRTVLQSRDVNKSTINRLKQEIADLMVLIDGEEKLAAE